MKNLVFFILLFFSFSQIIFSQTNLTVEPQFTTQKIVEIPDAQDDKETQKLLRELTKKSGWFPDLQITVGHGIVLIEGNVKDQKQLTWLTQTADKLPTVIAVVNKAELITPPLTDMSPFFAELKKIMNSVKKNLPRVGMGILMASFFIFLGMKILSLLKDMWGRKITNVFLATTVARLLMIPIWLTFFYLSLLTIGLQSLAGTILGGTGVVGIVLGFAFKGIAENYLSGLLLAIRSPFTKGDSVKIDNIEGIVQNLNMRGTTLLDFDGNLVLVPNITVIQSVVKNLSVNQSKRATFTIGVGFSDNSTKCMELIAEALRSTRGVCQEPSPSINVEAVGVSSINIKVQFWFNAKDSSESGLKSSAIVKTKELLLANGMHLPDGAREIVLTEALRVQMIGDRSEAQAAMEEKKLILKAQAKVNFNEADQLNTSEDSHEHELRKIANQVSLPTQSGTDNLLAKH
jgi:small conductance mechanosensitive channel